VLFHGIVFLYSMLLHFCLLRSIFLYISYGLIGSLEKFLVWNFNGEVMAWFTDVKCSSSRTEGATQQVYSLNIKTIEPNLVTCLSCFAKDGRHWFPACFPMNCASQFQTCFNIRWTGSKC
jgi:hypothetical protein